MKKIETGVTERLHRCVLYKEDIARVAEALTTEDQKPTFRASGYETDDLEEFYTLLGTKGATDVRIARNFGDVRLWTTSDGDSLIVSADKESIEIEGRVALTVRALRQCEQRLPISKQPWFMPVTFSCLGAASVLSFAVKDAATYVIFGLGLVGLIGFIWDWIEKRPVCRFYGISREEAPVSPWAARRKDWLDKIPLLFIGALLTLLGQWLLKKLQ